MFLEPLCVLKSFILSLLFVNNNSSVSIKFKDENHWEFCSEFVNYLSAFKHSVFLLRRVMWFYFLFQYIWPIVLCKTSLYSSCFDISLPWYESFFFFNPLHWVGKWGAILVWRLISVSAGILHSLIIFSPPFPQWSVPPLPPQKFLFSGV